MTSEPQEIVSGKSLAAKSSEVDFAIVLSRVIASIENDPAQLRSAVYELARIKLQTELSINVSERRDLALALESAIERVETVSSKHDHVKVLQSLDRFSNRSEVDAYEVTIEGREAAPIIKHLPSFLTRAVDGSRKVESSSHWMGAAPLVRAAVVAVLGIVLCIVLDRHFGLFGRQPPQPFASVVHKVERPETKPVIQASADGVQTPITTPSTQSLGFPLPSVYGIMRSVTGSCMNWSRWSVECQTKEFSCRRPSRPRAARCLKMVELCLSYIAATLRTARLNGSRFV